jgi:hypothetical protein
MTTVCYLDFDGHLHDCAVYCSAERGIHIRTPDRTLFEWIPILEELFAPYPDIQIVLSTSWVAAQSFEFARAQLSPTLQQRVIGSTYTAENLRYFDSWPRGRQVTSDVAARKLNSWFAIDDDDDGWPTSAKRRLIKTDGTTGISTTAVQDEVRKMLSAMTTPAELAEPKYPSIINLNSLMLLNNSILREMRPL